RHCRSGAGRLSQGRPACAAAGARTEQPGNRSAAPTWTCQRRRGPALATLRLAESAARRLARAHVLRRARVAPSRPDRDGRAAARTAAPANGHRRPVAVEPPREKPLNAVLSSLACRLGMSRLDVTWTRIVFSMPSLAAAIVHVAANVVALPSGKR